jgi:hypothetical protein
MFVFFWSTDSDLLGDLSNFRDVGGLLERLGSMRISTTYGSLRIATKLRSNLMTSIAL